MFRLCFLPVLGSGKATKCKGNTERQNSVLKWLHRKVQGKAQSWYCRGRKISIVETSYYQYLVVLPVSYEGLMMAYSSAAL